MVVLSVDLTLADHAGELAMLRAIDSLFQVFRFAPLLLLWFALPVAEAQQHRHDFRGPRFSGGQNIGTGNVRVSGGGTFGPPGTAQQLGAQSPSFGAGSRSTWTHSHGTRGVSRGTGVWNYSQSVPTPGFNTFHVIPNVYPSSFNNGYLMDPTGYSMIPYYGVGPGWSMNPYIAAGGQGPLWFRHPIPGNLWANSLWLDPFGFPNGPNAWCLNSMPYFGGTNPYFAGSVLMPTLISMNVNMMPSVPSTASYTITDPRLLDVLAPPQNQQMQPANVPFQDVPPAPQPDADLPLLNEFDPSPRSDRVSTLSEKIQSLRHQSAGDDAFRHQRYDDAVAFYQSAIDTAPDRRAPWIRMAFAQIAMKRFDFAIARLKTGLSMPDDAGRSWVTADELYGNQTAERARSHGLDLLNWLAERPTSADRLLLVGAFQQLRGHDEVAAELLQLSSHEGPEAELASAVTRIAKNDIGQRAAAQDLVDLKDAAENNKVVPASETRDPNGIYLDGNALARPE